jgi:hypothetical protein
MKTISMRKLIAAIGAAALLRQLVQLPQMVLRHVPAH